MLRCWNQFCEIFEKCIFAAVVFCSIGLIIGEGVLRDHEAFKYFKKKIATVDLKDEVYDEWQFQSSIAVRGRPCQGKVS